MTVSEVADRVEGRFKPVLERISPRRETPTERLKGAVEDATGRLAEQAREGKESVTDLAGRVGHSRGPTDRVGDFVSERLDRGTAGVWGSRAALVSLGLLLGFVLGWLARAKREPEDSGDALPEELAQVPAGMPRGSRFDSEAAPSR
ncbi:MAG: hypothetical protein ABR592_00605 [Nitriliruptorales bacterium]